MNAHDQPLTAARLEPLHLPASLRGDLHLEYGKGDNPSQLSRLQLEGGIVAPLYHSWLHAILYPNGASN